MLFGIIGSGNLGTALAKVLSDKHTVILYDINLDIVSEINSKHTNSKFLAGVKLSHNISASCDLSSIKNVDLIIIAVPSRVMGITCNKLKKYYNNQTILSFTKGLSDSGEVMTDVIIKELRCQSFKVLAVSGPCIATELAEGKPTLLMIGGRKSISNKISKYIETDYFLIKTTTDKKGIQFLGFYKNIIAILVGICDGLSLGKNFESSLLTRAYNEFYYLNAGITIKRHTFVSPAGLGDLYVTTMSNHSRNRTFGCLIGQGMDCDSAIKKIGQTVEGYDNLLLLSKLKNKFRMDKDLIAILMEIVHNNKNHDKIKKLLMKYLYNYRERQLEELIFPIRL